MATRLSAVALTPGDPITSRVQQMLPDKDVLAEVDDADSYAWVALVSGDGVQGAHRALLANGCAYLRGVYTFTDGQGLLGYQLAKAVLATCAARGLLRAHIWLETHGREQRIARLLGVRHSATPLNRYRLGLADVRSCGLDHVHELMTVVDRGCAVSHPPFCQDDLPRAPEHGWRCQFSSSELPGADSVEFSWPASDIAAALEIRSMGGRRMNRYPVLHAGLALGAMARA